MIGRVQQAVQADCLRTWQYALNFVNPQFLFSIHFNYMVRRTFSSVSHRQAYLTRSREFSPSFRSDDQGAAGAYTKFARAIRAKSYWLRILAKARQLSSRSATSGTPTSLNCSQAASYSARATRS